MRNIDSWKETKVLFKKGKMTPNLNFVNPGSLIMINRQLEYYGAFISKYCKGSLLDCGCGTVPYFPLYNNKVDSVYCIDWQSSLHDNKHIDQFVDLSKPLPIKSNSYDSIILTDVLEHISNPDHLVSELTRVLRKNGIIFISVPFFYWLHEEPHDFHRYTKFSLQTLCDNNNLDVEIVSEYGGLNDIIFDLMNKVIFRSKLLGKFLFLFTRFLEKVPFYSRIRKATAEKFPLGYVLVARKR